MLFVKIPRIIYKVLNFEFIIIYKNCRFYFFLPTTLRTKWHSILLKNLIFLLEKWKGGRLVQKKKEGGGEVGLYSGSYSSFFLLRPSLLIFLFSFYFSSFSTSFMEPE
jgi:hypothetical protein